MVEVLARRSAPPWKWRTNWLVDVGVGLTLPVAGISLRLNFSDLSTLSLTDLRTRSGGRRRAAASAKTRRPSPAAYKEAELGTTRLVGVFVLLRILVLRITTRIRSHAHVFLLLLRERRGRKRNVGRSCSSSTGSTQSWSHWLPSMFSSSPSLCFLSEGTKTWPKNCTTILNSNLEIFPRAYSQRRLQETTLRHPQCKLRCSTQVTAMSPLSSCKASRTPLIPQRCQR